MVINALFLCPEGGEAVVSCERCIPAGGAGEHTEMLLIEELCASCSAEETPEYKAKVAADHKAKREKEAKERQESIERSQKAADEQRRIQEENYWQRSIESILHEQMLNNNNFAFGNTIESMLARYETGISAPV